MRTTGQHIRSVVGTYELKKRAPERRQYSVVLPFIIPLIIFGIPLGMGNGLAQPVALACITFFLTSTLSASLSVAYLAIYVIAVTIVPTIGAEPWEISWFQAFRSGVTYFFFTLILANYETIQKKLNFIISHTSKAQRRAVLAAPYVFIIGQIVQVGLFQAGIKLANASLSSDSNGRIFLFPHSATLIIFYYASANKRILLAVGAAGVLLASGSKASLACMIVLAILAALKTPSFKSLVAYSVAVTCVGALALQVNTVAVERLTEFATAKDRVDITRAYEIFHAKQSWLETTPSTLFGNGFAKAISPGIRSTDPRWAENSRYDVENGYWAVLAKVGLVGAALTIFFLARLKRDRIFVASLAIMVVIAASSSQHFFSSFDGCYLLLWGMYARWRESLPD